MPSMPGSFRSSRITSGACSAASARRRRGITRSPVTSIPSWTSEQTRSPPDHRRGHRRSGRKWAGPSLTSRCRFSGPRLDGDRHPHQRALLTRTKVSTPPAARGHAPASRPARARSTACPAGISCPSSATSSTAAARAAVRPGSLAASTAAARACALMAEQLLGHGIRQLPVQLERSCSTESSRLRSYQPWRSSARSRRARRTTRGSPRPARLNPWAGRGGGHLVGREDDAEAALAVTHRQARRGNATCPVRGRASLRTSGRRGYSRAVDRRPRFSRRRASRACAAADGHLLVTDSTAWLNLVEHSASSACRSPPGRSSLMYLTVAPASWHAHRAAVLGLSTGPAGPRGTDVRPAAQRPSVGEGMNTPPIALITGRPPRTWAGPCRPAWPARFRLHHRRQGRHRPDGRAAQNPRAVRPGTSPPSAGDVTDARHRRRALPGGRKAAAGVDLLVVNNAGTLGASPLPALADYPADELRAAFEVNVIAPIALTQQLLPLLRRTAAPSSTSPRTRRWRDTPAGVVTCAAKGPPWSRPRTLLAAEGRDVAMSGWGRWPTRGPCAPEHMHQQAFSRPGHLGPPRPNLVESRHVGSTSFITRLRAAGTRAAHSACPPARDAPDRRGPISGWAGFVLRRTTEAHDPPESARRAPDGVRLAGQPPAAAASISQHHLPAILPAFLLPG